MTLAKEPVQTTVAPLEPLQRLRSYSRRTSDGRRETWDETCDRTLYSPHLGLKVLGKFTDEEMALIDEMQRKKIAFGSARWLWVGGTEWIEKPENYPGAFNCTSFRIVDWKSFAMLMDLAMQGSGTGAVLELDCIEQLPAIANRLNVEIKGKPGDYTAEKRAEKTACFDNGDHWLIAVGDSRQGWVRAYRELLELAADADLNSEVLRVVVDLSCVRPSGEKLKGFGGTANPAKLADMFINCAEVLNGAVGRKLNSLEVCLLLGEAASAVVAGNIRRSAGMKQGSADDELFVTSKDNLWTCDESGAWKIDPKRDSLRTANHTRVYHRKPSSQECVESVRKQFYSGEGAIQYAPEAIARGNADLLVTPQLKQGFLDAYSESVYSAHNYLSFLIEAASKPKGELEHRMQRYALNPCGSR